MHRENAPAADARDEEPPMHARTSRREEPPERPVTEIAVAPAAAAPETGYSATRTSAGQPPSTGEPDAEHSPPRPPIVIGAPAPPTPVKIRPVKIGRRRSPVLGAIAAAMLLAIVGLGVYLLVSSGHGARPETAGPSRSATPLARPTPSLSAGTSAPRPKWCSS